MIIARELGGRFRIGWRPRCLVVALAAVLLLLQLARPGYAQEPVDYILGAGDRVRITVFEEEDLTGEFEVTSTGMISFPLIGQIRASGGTLAQLEIVIAQMLLDGYLKSPRVNAEVLNYRPFFIEGEVETPGQYPYTRISQVSSIFSAARRRFCYKNHEVVAYMERRIWHTRWVNRNRGAFGSFLTVD